MFFGVFRFAKTMKLLNKGGIRCISRFFPEQFYCMHGPSLVELTGVMSWYILADTFCIGHHHAHFISILGVEKERRTLIASF